MQQVVSITSQGQLTIPKSMREDLGIKGAVKAVVKTKGRLILVEPKDSFWDLVGSLKTKVKLSDKQLREARRSFAKEWGKNVGNS